MKKLMVVSLLCILTVPALGMGPMNLISPYVKGGVEIHSNDDTSTWPVIGGVGAELNFPMVPMTPFLEGAYTWHSENGVDMKNIPVTAGLKYKLIPLPMITPYLAGGVSMNFMSYEVGEFSYSETKFGMSLRGGVTVSKFIVEIAYNKIFQEGSGNHFYLGAGIKL
jgi:hypothetical protein